MPPKIVKLNDVQTWVVDSILSMPFPIYDV
jgi:hypothetical protein